MILSALKLLSGISDRCGVGIAKSCIFIKQFTVVISNRNLPMVVQIYRRLHLVGKSCLQHELGTVFHFAADFLQTFRRASLF